MMRAATCEYVGRVFVEKLRVSSVSKVCLMKGKEFSRLSNVENLFVRQENFQNQAMSRKDNVKNGKYVKHRKV